MPTSSCHVPRLKVLESDLSSLGFSSNWRLTKEKTIPDAVNEDSDNHDNDFLNTLLNNTKQPRCQNVDVIAFNKQRTQIQQHNFEKFLKIIGSPCVEDDVRSHSDSKGMDMPSHSFVEDESARAFQIEQFISTEESYVEKLQTLVDVIVQPLKTRAQEKDRNAPLNLFLCSKIFINIEEITYANKCFLDDLQDCMKGEANTTFGDICATHAAKFDCYRKYLLGKSEAQQFQTKEFKSNQAYRSFLVKAIEHQQYKGFHSALPELLMEPAQRIARYTMMLKGYTPETHPDFDGLTKALSKLSEIAMMADDDPTKLANLFHTLLKSIKDIPDSIMKQGRSLVAHLDAVEIHRVSNKPIRPVTLFLFTDLVMVAARPSHGSKTNDLCAIDPDSRAFPDIHGSFISRGTRKDPSLKFKGWVDVEQVEIFEGAPVIPSKDSSIKQDEIQQYLEKGAKFVDAIRKTQALAKQYSDDDMTYHRYWNNLDIYSNIYTPKSYLQAKYKNNFVVVYVEEDEHIDVKQLLKHTGASPWVVALVQADTGGFRLSISSKVQLGPARDRPRSISEGTGSKCPHTADNKTVDFECIFWNNVIICERHLRSSTHFCYLHNKTTDEELQKRSRSRSRSLSISRSTSIPTLSKIFGASGSSRSRSSSPNRSSRVAPTPSRSSPTSQNSSKTSSSESGSLQDISYQRNDKQRRPRSKSMVGPTSNPPIASRETNPKSATTYRVSTSSADTFYLQQSNERQRSHDSLSQLEEPNYLTSCRHKRSPSAFKLSLPDIDSYGGVPRKDNATFPVRRQEGTYPTQGSIKADMGISGATIDRLSSPESYWDQGTSSSGRRNSQSQDIFLNCLQGRYSSDSQSSPVHFSSGSPFSRSQNSRSDSATPPSISSLGLQEPHSRPSSRSSTTSSTNSIAINQFANYGCPGSSRSSFSNTMSSFASQSTRSSVSWEELELLKGPTGYSPPPRPGMHSEYADDDDLLMRIHERLSSRRKSNYGEKFIPRYNANERSDQSPHASVESTASIQQPLDQISEMVDNLGKDVNKRWHQFVEKCRLLDMHTERLTTRLQAVSEKVSAFNGIDATLLEELGY
ncbi:hypothetical protein EC973_006059 [Apophysomyces ossiformis]|uniref:DH domain-containing protein n=1 Tax=Apophysomyces ossiformis TaxID=679940 RepID=A0A8H7BR52_9FUNG|nr:hypothetical protein EC973_006059 [Apophysomyces ossiformis]